MVYFLHQAVRGRGWHLVDAQLYVTQQIHSKDDGW